MLLILLLAAAVPAGCNSPRSQLAMNRCAQAEWQAADVEMTAQWRQTMRYMTKRDKADKSRGGGFGFAGALLESQRAWLKFRDTQCVMEGGQFAGGSAQAMTMSRCRTHLTRERTVQLKALIWPR